MDTIKHTYSLQQGRTSCAYSLAHVLCLQSYASPASLVCDDNMHTNTHTHTHVHHETKKDYLKCSGSHIYIYIYIYIYI